MKRLGPDLAQRLAGEYVLGTLRGRARARFEALMREDASLAGIVAQWEAELTPLAERVAPVEPPARVWRAIEARIGPARAASPTGWRAFAFISGGLASVLLAAFLWLSQGPRGEPLFIVVLNSVDAVPHALVSMHSPDVLRIRMVKPVAGVEGRDLELWVVPKEGAPRSLGVMPNVKDDTIIRITSTDPRVRGAQSLLVTLEPQGGSRTGGPSGPSVLQGPIVPVRRS